MYCNLFDTVRTSAKDQIYMEGILYTSILNHRTPIFSLNQIVDSPMIMNICKNHREFYHFVGSGTIRVAQFHKGNKLIGNIQDYLFDALHPIEGLACNPFRFSRFSFLYDREQYRDDQRQRIYCEMLRCVQDAELRFSPGIAIAQEHKEVLEEYLSDILLLAKNLNDKYVRPAEHSGPSLSERIDEGLKDICTGFEEFRCSPEAPENVNSDFIPAMQELQARFHSLRGQIAAASNDEKRVQLINRLNSRSWMYRELESMGCDEVLEAELKGFVDLCYNEKVAASICDDEDDIMVNCVEFHNLRPYLQTDAKAAMTHKIDLVSRADRFTSGYFTWEKLKEIHEMAQKRCVNDKYWQDVVLQCCDEAGIKHLETSRSGFLKQLFFVPAISTLAAEVSSDVIEKLLQNDPGAAVGGALSAIVAMLGLADSIGANIRAWKSYKEYEDMKELLTQEAYVKPNYNKE